MITSGMTRALTPPLLVYGSQSPDHEHDRLQYSSPNDKEYAQELRRIRDELHRNGREQHENAHERGYQSFGQDGGATTDQSSTRSPHQARPNTQNRSSQAQTPTDPPTRRASFVWYCSSCWGGPYSYKLTEMCLEPICQRPYNDDCPREQIIRSNPMIPWTSTDDLFLFYFYFFISSFFGFYFLRLLSYI